MKTRAVVVLAAVVLLGAMGYAAGRLASPRVQQRAPVVSFPVITSTTENVTVPMPALEDLNDLPAAPFESVLYAVARAKPESLRAYSKRLEDVKVIPTRVAATEIFFRTLMQTNPALAKELIFQQKGGLQSIALYAIKNAAPAQAMPCVVDIIRNGDVGQTSGCSFDYLRDALRDWSQTDPRAARDYLEAHSDIRMQAYYDIVLGEWAAYEPNEARAWRDETIKKIKAESKEESGSETQSQLQYLEQAWVEGLFRYDHTAAIKYVLAGSGDPDKDCAPDILKDMYLESPDQARAFVEQLPTERQRTALRGMIYMAEGAGDDAATREDQIRSPEFLADWIVHFPPQTWDRAVGSIVGAWRAKDPDGLYAWMQNLPPDAQEAAIANYDPYLSPELTEKEFNTVMRAPDGPLRTQLLEKVMKSCNQSEDIMLACLAKAPLSQEQKQYLASLIPEQLNIDRASEDD